MISEGTMKQAFMFATMLWLAAFAAAQAQETQVETQTNSTGTVATDPLTVPTSTIPLSGGAATGSPSIGGLNAASSINPQTALQLPGETSNATTQSPTTTASAPAASAASAGASASSTLCSSSVSTTTGELSASSLAGGLSTNGC
jgi:hypothetical protein